MTTRPLLPLIPALLFLVGCGWSGGSAVTGSPCARAAGAEERVERQDTPYGEAAIEVLVEPRTIAAGEHVQIRLANRGDVTLLTGLPFDVERWDGERWVRVRQRSVFRLIGIVLRPGASTEPQRWPSEGVEARSGCYRVAKGTARLEAFARFRVRPTG